MRIFLAGATGAVGRRLLPVLVGAGHQVVGTTRSSQRARPLQAVGAEAVVLDVLDREAVLASVTAAKPDVVIHQATALAGFASLRKFDDYFTQTNRLRTDGTDHLLAAARIAGARRFIAQSYTGWPNSRTGSAVKTEEDPLDRQPTATSRRSLAAITYLESAVTSADGIEGVVVRYGSLYGPGTALGINGDMVEMVRRRRFPIVGGGAGVWSHVHIDDAATATMLAVEVGVPGTYNIVDDEPAPITDWLPELARAIGAEPPRHVPAWLARPLLGEQGIAMMTAIRGSSNAKAKRELGWKLIYPSWRQGFRTGLG
ncbi:MAG: NAD(P)-dependent oxidoreductase [Propionibacteriaceae bacterium]|nr:NAD(P)-dependent oxidoreductase [Propionibacteriaceae bacterium]